MEEQETDLTKMSWKELKKMLSHDPEYIANREVARRIVNNYQAVVEYFLGPMSKSIVESINKIMKRNAYTDYYFFISHPYNEETKRHEWHRIDLYDARDCSLVSYTSRISYRHFTKEAKKERARENSTDELLDYFDYESLLECDQSIEDGDNEDLIRMKMAYGKLNEKDQKVLKCLVIDKMPGIDAFPLLESYVNPMPKDGLTSDAVKKTWTTKQKQDVVSLMKGRALKRLTDNYNELKHNNM